MNARAEPHTFAFPTTVHLGAGVRVRLADELRAAGVARPLVVTDAGVAGLDFFHDLVERLEGTEGVEPAIFDAVRGNPVEAMVKAGVEAFEGHESDGIVAVGGGAATDVAKAVGLMAVNPGHILEYAEDALDPRTPGAPPPCIVCLPTTAGTGSEVGRSSVISEDATGRKRVVFQPVMLPKVVLADPELLVGLPPPLTAATGMDALSHLIEAFLATGYHPMCDGIALEGLRLVRDALARSVAHPDDLGARETMLMAAMMGAVAFQKGLGLTHACAHALSAVLGTHHGLANAVMLEGALRHNAGDETCAARMARMARGLDLADASADGFIAWVAALRDEVGLPADPAAVGVEADHLDRLVAVAVHDGCLATTPVPADEAVLRALLAAGT